MKNLAIAIAAGLVIFALLTLTGLLSAAESALPGILTAVIAYYVLARRTFKQVERVFTEAGKALSTMPPKLELAVATLGKAYPLGAWQFGVRSQVDTQIGVIYFLQQDFNKATPYLQRSLTLGHWLGGAMLAVIQYKKKDHAEMRKTLDTVTKRAKGQGLVWSLYAYLLTQAGDRDGAIRVLAEGLKKTKNDPKLQDALLAVQNNKKIKMRVYKEQWYQFHLERPPVDQQQQFVLGGRLSKQERRGRW
jgi:tetratricopeptide (TPR) repeat protein